MTDKFILILNIDSHIIILENKETIIGDEK